MTWCWSASAGISHVRGRGERLEAGADLLQAYTAFIYEGPWWPTRINAALATARSRRQRQEADRLDSSHPFGARLRAAMDGRGPLCAGIDPHAVAAGRLGTDRLGQRAGEVRPRRHRGARAAGRRDQAAVGVLRAVRLARDRGARAGDRHRPRGRCARRARREARRHRLDRAGLRRCLPRPALADRRGRDHRSAVPRVRQPRADVRHRPRARRRCVRAGADLQPRGAAVPARPHRRRRDRGRHRAGRARGAER